MPRPYPPEFRERAIALVRKGRQMKQTATDRVSAMDEHHSITVRGTGCQMVGDREPRVRGRVGTVARGTHLLDLDVSAGHLL